MADATAYPEEHRAFLEAFAQAVRDGEHKSPEWKAHEAEVLDALPRAEMIDLIAWMTAVMGFELARKQVAARVGKPRRKRQRPR